MELRGIIFVAFCFLWSCGQARPGQAPSELLIAKWKVRFAVLDVNHDTVLSFADATEMSNIFTDLYNMTGDEAQYTSARVATWRTTCVGNERTGHKTEDEYLAEYTDAITKDRKAFETLRRDCFYLSANIADVDGDVHISETEWVIWCQSYGIDDGGLLDMFETFQPINGLVPIAWIVDELVEFATDEENVFQWLLDA